MRRRVSTGMSNKILFYVTLFFCVCQHAGLVFAQRAGPGPRPSNMMKKWERYYQNDPSGYDLTLTAKDIFPKELLSDSDIAVKVFKRTKKHPQQQVNQETETESESSTRGESPIVVEIEIDNHDPEEFFLYMQTKDGYEICAMELSPSDDNDDSSRQSASLCSADDSLFHFGDNTFVISVYSTHTKRLLLQTKSHVFFTNDELLDGEVLLHHRFQNTVLGHVVESIIRQQKTIALTGSLLLLMWLIATKLQLPSTNRGVLLEDTSISPFSGGNGDDGDSGDVTGNRTGSATGLSGFRDGRVDYYQPRPLIPSSSSAVTKTTPQDVSSNKPVSPPIRKSSVKSKSQKELSSFSEGRRTDGARLVVESLSEVSRKIRAKVKHHRRLCWTLIGIATVTSAVLLTKRGVVSVPNSIQYSDILKDIGSNVLVKLRLKKNVNLSDNKVSLVSHDRNDNHDITTADESFAVIQDTTTRSKSIPIFDKSISVAQPHAKSSPKHLLCSSLRWSWHSLNKKFKKQDSNPPVDELDLILCRPTSVPSPIGRASNR